METAAVEQVTALQQAHLKLARMRADHIETEEGYHLECDHLDIAIKRLENRLAVLRVQREPHVKDAKALSGARLGSTDIPRSITIQLNEKQTEIDSFDKKIDSIDKELASIREKREDAHANRVLAQQAIAEIDGDIRATNEQIKELRGF
jgi:chromosome segregation ATPase